MTKIFKIPFGALGDKQEVPVPTQTDGSVSYEQGFGIDYQRDYEDPQAKDIPREGLNQLFYDMTKALGELQKLGYMQWQAGEYQAGDRVAEGGVAYKAVRATTNKPPHSDWVSVSEGGEFVTVDTNQTVGGVKTFSKFPVTPSAAPTANYQAANKKYVDDKVGGSAIGVEQTWQDVTASRASGTTYTNSTGKPIQIFITFDPAGLGPHFLIDGVNILPDNDTVYYQVACIVPAGSTYRMVTLATAIQMKWMELR